MSELFATDAWVAMLEIMGTGGIVAAIGMYVERRNEGRGKNDHKMR